jgi:hypothetical protein
MANFHQCCPVGTCVSGCETYRTCNGEPCDGSFPLAIASYLTIGKPAGNLMFDGPYWTAWHNGITSLSAATDVSFKINCYKRTFVQQACGASGCIALPTPSTLVSCVTPAMTADPDCQRTAYTDNYIWQMAGRVAFVGASNDQLTCTDTSPTQAAGYPAGMATDAVQYNEIYPMPFPNELVDTTRSGVSPTRPETTGRNANWIPGESRCLAPRFSSTIPVTRSDVPSTTYTITASCGGSNTVGRCDTVADTANEVVCWDFLTVIPGHDSTMSAGDYARCEPSGASCECGLPSASYPAHVDSPENGAANAAWGIDIKDDELYNILLGWGINTTVSIGTLATAWVVLTAAGKVRILFGIEGSSQALAAGGVLKWKDNVAVGRSETITLSSAGHSLVMTVDITITPQGWCKQNSRCPCVVSYSEQDLCQITTTFHGGSGGSPDSIFGAGCTHVVNYGNYVLGLEDYDIPYCSLAPPGCTTGCQNYPISGSFSWAPPYSTRSDFVGCTPVERAHAGWKQYRNKFNHWRLVNSNLTAQALGPPGVGTDCCYTGKLIYGGANWDQIYNTSCTDMTAAFKAANGPCAGDVGSCSGNLDWPNTVPAGCHHVIHNTSSTDFSIGLLMNSPTCMVCTPQFNNYYACGPCFFVGACGSTLFDDCECCNTQLSIALPEVMIVDYVPADSCTPLGTWDLYQATAATMCDRASWLPLGYAVIT